MKKKREQELVVISEKRKQTKQYGVQMFVVAWSHANMVNSTDVHIAFIIHIFTMAECFVQLVS